MTPRPIFEPTLSFGSSLLEQADGLLPGAAIYATHNLHLHRIKPFALGDVTTARPHRVLPVDTGQIIIEQRHVLIITHSGLSFRSSGSNPTMWFSLAKQKFLRSALCSATLCSLPRRTSRSCLGLNDSNLDPKIQLLESSLSPYRANPCPAPARSDSPKAVKDPYHSQCWF